MTPASENLKRLTAARKRRLAAADRLSDAKAEFDSHKREVGEAAAARAHEVAGLALEEIECVDIFAREGSLETIRKLLYELYRAGPLITVTDIYRAVDLTRQNLDGMVERIEQKLRKRKAEE